MTISGLQGLIDKYGGDANIERVWVEECKEYYGIDENQPDWWRVYLDPTTQTIAALARIEERRN